MTLPEIIDAIGVEPYYREDAGVIYNADCLDILPRMPEKCVDLVVTDPPYGIGVNKMTLGNRKGIIYRGERNWDDTPANIEFILSIGCPVIIWGGNYFKVPPSRCWLVWDKGTGNNDFADCELAWTNLDKVVKKYFRSWVGANAKEHFEYDRNHPTQKPISLMEWCIKQANDEAQTILDPFLGSGTTAVAAKQLGRKYIGIEIEEKYCDIARQRLAQEILI